MKKSVLYLLFIILALNSCTKKKDDPDIFKEYFEEWGITIPYKKYDSTSETYNLLEVLIDNIYRNAWYPLNFIYSNPIMYNPTDFNNYIRNNEETAAFFKREDCLSVLISTYLISLKAGGELTIDGSNYLGNRLESCFSLLEKVLSSDICMSKMNVKEKVQLMVLALESAKYINSYTSFTIMISIMLSSNYTPFVNDVKPLLIETSNSSYYRVVVDGNYDHGVLPSIDSRASDLLTEYAKKFINNNKK